MLKIPATIFCIALIIYVFRIDRRETRDLSFGLWIPTIWLMIVSSRPVSQWFYSGSYDVTAESMEAGSPLDRFVFSVLLIVALWCLARRRLPWADILRSNPWVVAVVMLAGISVLWSDYPLVSFKRWVRGVGAVATALIVVAEKDNFRAVQTILRRVAFLLIPLSVLFAKYYWEFGVGYGLWGGMQVTGATNNKNTLGRLCLLSILYFVFVLLQKRWKTEGRIDLSTSVVVGYLIMAIWLLVAANSKTALSTLLLGLFVLLTLRYTARSPARVNLLCLFVIPVSIVLILSTGAFSVIVEMLGRDTTLTTRTDLWPELLAIRGDFLVGAGYGGFWIGDRLAFLWEKHWWLPTTAHNGYLEIFLQLGFLGLALLLACLASAYLKIQRILAVDQHKGGFYLALFLIFLFYNITESATSLSSMMWFVFSLHGLTYSQSRQISYPKSRDPSERQ